MGKTFRHQFQVLARRAPVTAKPRHSKSADRKAAPRVHYLSRGRRVEPAAAKHRRAQRGKASAPYPVDTSWPADMILDLEACRTASDYQAWAQKWAAVLSGEAARLRRRALRPPPRRLG